MTDAVFATIGSDRAPEGIDRRKEQRQTLVLLAIALAARIPFLWHGFGGHPDEWLVIRSGLDFWLHGIYYPSRIPGYPLNELLMGGLAWLGGATACAAAATVASLITFCYLQRLAPLYGVRNPFWMVLAFSFEPWVWSSGTHGLDYIWGTGALIAALYYVERRRFGAAGLACAIGYGFRPSSLVWIVPVFVRVLILERRWREVLRFALWAAVPALIPTAMMIWVMITRPDAWAGMGPLGAPTLGLVKNAYSTLLVLASYHLIELIGVPAAALMIVFCWFRRDRLLRIFRDRKGWVWIFIAIFVCLLPTFVEDSEKTEYMLPALPGLFLILGRCLSDVQWMAMAATLFFCAFVSLGFGHTLHTDGIRLAVAAPSLRPGALLWYAERAKESNEIIARTGAVLSQSSAIMRASNEFDRLDEFYVSSLLKRGPSAQARISCPLAPARLSFPTSDMPEIRASKGLPKAPPSAYQMLVCCPSTSALLLHNTPRVNSGKLDDAIKNFCSLAPPLREQ